MKRAVYVPCSDGVRVCAHESGSGPMVCILLHGIGEGSFVWEGLSSALSGTYRMLAVDLRGHGNSDWDPYRNYNVDRYANDVLCVMEHLGIKTCCLVGHSLGGAVSLRLMALLRRSVHKAILVDVNETPDIEMSKELYALVAAQYRKYRCYSEYLDMLVKSRPSASEDSLRSLARASLKERQPGEFWPRFDFEVMRGLVDSAFGDLHPLSGYIPDFPVLLMRGRYSAMLSRQSAEAFVRRFPLGRLVTIPASGHAIMTDNPSAFVSAAVRFLETRL
jgi:3-oxoadipate enol-lactonase